MVSVLVPVYNASRYLAACVNSLIGQTYADLQIVLINDGSTDDSWQVMLDLAQRDSRIEIYDQVNQGVASTRNNLLDKVRGDYVLFVDSDDWIEPETIELATRQMAVPECDLVAFQMVNSRHEDQGKYSREEIVKQFLQHILFNGSLCNKLFKTEILSGLRFDESVSYGEDALMVWQVIQRVRKVVVINDHLYHIGRNLDSLTRQQFNGRKCTAYTVWNTICDDADKQWPQYSELAHARFAIEMTKILRDAVLGGYNNKAKLSVLQWEVRKDKHLIRKTGMSTTKMWLFATLVSRHYQLVRFLSRYINLK